MARQMNERELETALRDVGDRLAYPETDMWPAVRARIAAGRRPWWQTIIAQRSPLIPVAVTLVVILVVILALSPDARAKAAEILGLRGVQIIPVKETPSPTPTRTTGATPTPTFQGRRVSLADARTQAGFLVRVPSALGEPEDVYLDTASAGNVVTLVYRERAGIPVSPVAGVSAVVVEVTGSVDAQIFAKLAGPGTRYEALPVNGGPGVWLEGEPHQIMYRDARGNFIQDTLRLAGNTLLWEQGGVTLRLEAQVPKAEALRIAATFR